MANINFSRLPWKEDRWDFLSIEQLGFELTPSKKTEETAGMIPRAVEQVFNVASYMKSKGWEYKMEGQFLEIVRQTDIRNDYS